MCCCGGGLRRLPVFAIQHRARLAAYRYTSATSRCTSTLRWLSVREREASARRHEGGQFGGEVQLTTVYAVRFDAVGIAFRLITQHSEGTGIGVFCTRTCYKH